MSGNYIWGGTSGHLLSVEPSLSQAYFIILCPAEVSLYERELISAFASVLFNTSSDFKRCHRSIRLPCVCMQMWKWKNSWRGEHHTSCSLEHVAVFFLKHYKITSPNSSVPNVNDLRGSWILQTTCRTTDHMKFNMCLCWYISSLFRFNSVLMLCWRLGTKTTWSGLG